ncbi:mucin-2 [Clupea harengus]|uniref:Mucin-2 n=1 Tax=Clupea harengus TaxID=7950 RepID=A0A6P8ESI4_CLUHA|nr:mucin-2 [Clupea harengus]
MTTPLPTLPVPPQNDTLSPKPFTFTASTAVATSLPPGTGTAPLEPITTPAASTHQTDSDLLNTGTLTPAASTHQTDSGLLNTGTWTPALVATQIIPQSTLIPVSTQTTQQSPPESVPEKTTLKMTSLPPTPTQGLLTSEAPQTPVQLSVAPAKQDDPPQLDVGDEDAPRDGHPPASPLDPILTGLVSIFIVCTAIASVLLFLKFRHRHEHPEFHRLQDLPMDDLLEDTPLSRYSY